MNFELELIDFELRELFAPNKLVENANHFSDLFINT